MLTHRCFMANSGGFQQFDPDFKFLDTDVYISYLPLAHVFERMMMILCMAFRAQYGFYQGDVMKINEDLQKLQPTVMVSVPRLFNRFYDVMQARIKDLTGMKKSLCEWGINAKLANLQKNA